MAELQDDCIHIEEDLMINIKNWLSLNVADIKYQGRTPQFYIEHPSLIENVTSYPAIYIYPIKTGERSSAGGMLESDIDIGIDALLNDDYKLIVLRTAAWAADLRNVLRGKIEINSTATSGTTTTLTDSSLAEKYVDDFFNGDVNGFRYTITTISGTGSGQTLRITDYDGTLGKFTFATATAPGNDTVYKVTGINYWQRGDYLADQIVSTTKYHVSAKVFEGGGPFGDSLNYISLNFKGVKYVG